MLFSLLYFTVQQFQLLTFNIILLDIEIHWQKKYGQFKDVDQENPHWNQQDTACMSTAPLQNSFFLLSLSLLIKTYACTAMLRRESSIFSRGQHLNKSVSFFLAPVSQVWVWLQQAAESGFSYTSSPPPFHLLLLCLSAEHTQWDSINSIQTMVIVTVCH